MLVVLVVKYAYVELRPLYFYTAILCTNKQICLSEVIDKTTISQRNVNKIDRNYYYYYDIKPIHIGTRNEDKKPMT